MQVPEEADRAPILPALHHHLGRGRLRRRLGNDGVAPAVHGLEILAVERDPGTFARQHGIGLGAGRHQHRAGRQRNRLAVAEGPAPAALVDLHALEAQRACPAALVHFHGERRQALGEPDAFLQRLRDFLMVQRVARRVDQPAPVSDGDAAPGAQQLTNARRLAGRGRPRPLRSQRTGMGEELFGDLGLLLRPRDLAVPRLAARKELLDLHRVIGERLGRGVDGRQPAAHHDHRQAYLEVGDAVGARRAGKLERHQEVRRHAHARRQRIRHRHMGRPSGPGRHGHMVEAPFERLVEPERAAEAHPADHGEGRAPLQQQPHELEEVLVPAHGDAVFGDAAEACHDALGQVLAEFRHVAHGPEGAARARLVHARERSRKRLDLEPVHRHHAVPVIHEVVGEAEAGGAEADHQHLPAAVRQRQRTGEVQRVPARQQAVDLEAPGQVEHVLQHARLDLRNIDRVLLLIDAGLHAVIADAVAGGGAERVVDAHGRERAQRPALGLEELHLGDLLFQRAARELDVEHRPAERARAAVAQPARAAVLALVVAEDAVMRLVERRLEVHAVIGEREALAPAQPRLREFVSLRAVLHALLGFDQAHGIDAPRLPEQHAVAVAHASLRVVERPGRVARRRLQLLARIRLVPEPAQHRLGEGLLLDRNRHMRPERRLDRRAVERGRLRRLHRPRGAALHEQPLAAIDRGERGVALRERLRLRLDGEQPGEAGFQLRRQRQHQRRFRLRFQRAGRRAGGLQLRAQRLIEALQEQRVEPDQPVAAIEVLEAETVGKGELCHGMAEHFARRSLPGIAGPCVAL